MTAVIRWVRPNIVLVPSPQDYTEDHTNTCHLAVSALFSRGVRNYASNPPVPPYFSDVALYHAEPYGLHDGLRQLIHPTHYVDISSVLPRKQSMLARHETQKAWLDASQGIGAYLEEMDAMYQQVGAMSGRFTYAEGWRLHSHLGFGPKDFDPLRDLLGEGCRVE